MLTLTDGTRLMLTENVKVILETTDLKKASPSVLSKTVCVLICVIMRLVLKNVASRVFCIWMMAFWVGNHSLKLGWQQDQVKNDKSAWVFVTEGY